MTREKIPELPSVESLFEQLERRGSLPEMTAEDQSRLYEEMSEADVVRYYQAVRALEDGQEREVLKRWIPKPKVLYHSSHEGSIETFELRSERKRHPNDPPRVYAAPMEAISSAFLLEHSNQDIFGSYDGGKTWVLVAESLDDLKKRNRKGFIYTFDSSAFDVTPEEGLGLYEWSSEDSVVPTSKRESESAIEMMLKLGVRIYVPSSEVSMEEFRNGDQALLLDKMNLVKLEALDKYGK